MAQEKVIEGENNGTREGTELLEESLEDIRKIAKGCCWNNFSQKNQQIHSTHISELNRIEREQAREMGIKRFGLKHGVVIEERGGEALPIPYQDRAQMWSDVAESF